ncbi:hypothetical protein [Ruania alba]|uniref:Uncharacterized protein n=1 Tax=Ruania alba TaxID=648782 RepID=A0A1H5MLZ5_9MICO|nr:hypothetical protein [Ruania alba]SEE90336.1 hypothetical protein SAMN04488554_3487 [Ruania alba]
MDGRDRWTATVETVAPGWLLVPAGMDDAARAQWVDGRATELRDIWGAEWTHDYDDDVRSLLDAAAGERSESDALLLFQVWPVFAPIACMCRIAVLPNDGLPPWDTWDGVAHRVEAPHVGPGVQYTERRVYTDDGGEVEVFSTAFVFNDGATALVVALQEMPAPVLNDVRAGFIGLLDSLRLESADGTVFTSDEPAGIYDDGPWRLEAV